jgi:ribosome-binding protein aMBF1 (putative translation factor)
MRTTRRGGSAQDRPQGAAEGEAGEIEEALRLLGRSGEADQRLRVAIVASFYPDLYQTALALLIEAREKAGLSQAELAACFGLPEQLVVSYESGARLLDVGEFVAFCRAIGVDPYELLREGERD